MSSRKRFIWSAAVALLASLLMLSVVLAVTGPITQDGPYTLHVTQMPDPGDPSYGFITQCGVGYASIPLDFNPDQVDDTIGSYNYDNLATVTENEGTVVSVDIDHFQIGSTPPHNLSFFLNSAGVPGASPSTVYVYDVTGPGTALYDADLAVYAANVRASAGNVAAYTFAVDPNPQFDADCFPEEEPPPGGESPALPADNRLNRGYGDNHLGILYPGAEGVVDLYDYATETYYTAFVTPDDIAPYVNDPPQSPVLIEEFGWVRVYVLPTGEIQFLFGPGPEGKWYVVIMADLQGTDRRGLHFDPNEQ